MRETNSLRPSFDPFDPALLKKLKEGKNLLAFSGGADSTALFYLLSEREIPFDIATMHYTLRPEAKEEAAYARKLARKFSKRCFIKEVSLSKKNFEHEARRLRYAFFEEIIEKNGYENLLTAHHLNDKTEWFLMQFCKGAGLVEMVGFETIERRDGYCLIRPLIHTPKAALLEFLHRRKIDYFQDRTNFDLAFRRNLFRHRFCDPLLERFQSGIQKSFRYLEADAKALFTPPSLLKIEALRIFKRGISPIEDQRRIDYVLKRMGYLSSGAQKAEIVRQKEGVVGGKIAIAITQKEIWIAPYMKLEGKMDKTFKERCRIAKIPAKIRPYLYHEGIDPAKIRYHDDTSTTNNREEPL